MTATIEAPAFTAGVYDGMPEAMYHADPVPGGSLSSTGARKLLPPSCPAKFRWETDNPPPPKETFELGSAAHKLVLGAGAELEIVDAADWRTKAAKEARSAARDAGRVPLLAAEHDQVKAMAAALGDHPYALSLLDPDHGKPEQSLFWQDENTGIWRRARIDWLPDGSRGSRLLVCDYKTADGADAASIRRAVANYGYYQQDAWYLDGIRALGLDDDPQFLFIVQEKSAPYLVHVIGLDDEAIEIGRARNAQACEIFRDCTAAGHWPGYSDLDITYISLPPWVARTTEDSLS